MNEGLIQNWNNTVTKNDDVYILGDVLFGSASKAKQIFDRLNYKSVYLVRGNHDSYNQLSKTGIFTWIRDYHEMKVIDPEAKRGFEYFVLCHFPFLTWNLKDHGSWALNGHVHNAIPPDYTTRRIDVGVDNPITNYAPISYAKLKEEMKKYSLPTRDHHGRTIDDPHSILREGNQ